MSKTSEYAQPVPDSVAPKAGDFVTFQPFPDAPANAGVGRGPGATILTILGFKVIKDYENTKMDGTREVFDALEFIVGTATTAGPRFLKMWPMKNSIHEKSNYSKLYKAATGALPAAKGSNPAQIVGKGIQADLLNEDKVSKKGTEYVRTGIKGLAAVFPSLRKDIVPAGSLMAALEVALTPKEKDGDKPAAPTGRPRPAAPAAGADEDVPF